MVKKTREQPSRKSRIVMICVWTLFVGLMVFWIAARTHVLRFLDGLVILVGVMMIFREITSLLREPE